MSYQEKKTIVSTLTGTLLLAAYCLYAFGIAHPDRAVSADVKVWATTILVFIGIGIAASIIIQIVFHIILSIAIAVKQRVNNSQCDDKETEKAIQLEMVEDEMDKLIGLKSMRVSFAIAGFGFIAALVSLVLNFSVVVMLNIIFISFSAGTIIEGISQLYFYRKGVKNG
jgi:hypothetical protein